MFGFNVFGIVEFVLLWNFIEMFGGVFNGYKSGVDEDFLLVLLLEDFLNVDEWLFFCGFELMFFILLRFFKKLSVYVFLVGCVLLWFNLCFVLYMCLFV